METKRTTKTIGKVLFVLIMTSTVFAPMLSTAQDFHHRNYNRGYSKPIVALTVGLGTRSFLINSNIDYINKMKESLEGWESTLMIGGSKVRFRTGFGSFKTDLSSINSIKQESIKGLFNIYLPTVGKYFRPYIIGGIDVTTLTFKGTFVPKSPLIISNPLMACTCQSSSSIGLPPPPPNPGDDSAPIQLEEATTTPPEIYSAKLTSTQMVSGLGGELNFQVNERFIGLFGEFRYGLPIVVTSPNASMNNTTIKKNTAVEFGIAIGLIGRKGAHRSAIR